ncbi:hypothetical protein P691DRAFT_645315, partial [Macrolepiota fuliginosa MF-IS2]
AAPQVYVPPPGLYCCPETGPNGWPLIERQVGPFSFYCMYVMVPGLLRHNPDSGIGATITGCPSQAPVNPHPPTCPI